MGGKLSSEVKEVLGKIKGEKHRAWIGVNEIHTSEFHEQDVIVIESVEADLSKKEILTHEVGDMVVIDTLELTMNDNVIDHNVTTADDIEAKSLQHKHILNDMNTLSSDTTNTTNSTSENEYFTTYDVAQDDDVGSLMYHTAYMDDESDDDVLASKPSETWEGGFIVGEVLDTPASPEIGENSSGLNGDSPDHELASMQRDSPESPHLDRKYRKMSQELHETPIKYSSSVFKEGEIMIDYPPTSSTPSHFSSSSGSVIRYDFQPEIPPRLFATALGRSPSSRSSSARSSVSVKTPKPSDYVTSDVILNTSPSSSRSSRRSSLDHHESVEVVIPSTSSNTHVKCDVTRSTSLG
uniref:Uncharacterized protein n=1 Tax=Ciona savignyi TaxID=51511 RepID=H2Z9P1_CIOSA